jgi:hypothetical protein
MWYALKGALKLPDMPWCTANVRLPRLALHNDGHGLRKLWQDPVPDQIDSEVILAACAEEGEAEAEEGDGCCVLEVRSYVNGPCWLQVDALCVFEKSRQRVVVN